MDRRLGQREPFKPKNFDLGIVSDLEDPWRVLGGPEIIKDHQGLTLGQKEPFKPKKNSAKAGNRWPLEGPRG